MKKYLKTFIVLTSLVLIAIGSYGQILVIGSEIKSDLLQKDFQVLQDSLQNIHAGLYRYKKKEDMKAIFEKAYQQLDHPMSETNFFAIVSHVISNIEDGHTECFLPRDYINSIIATVKVFPLQLRFIGDKAYVPCNATQFQAGTEIVSIDHKPIDKIRKELFNMLSSDGSIETEKYVKINDGHDPFSYLYYVAYGEKTNFKINYKTSSGKVAEKTLLPVLFNSMECPPVRIKVDKYLNLEYKQDGVAVLTLKTFANEFMEKTKENFESFLAASFKEIKAKRVQKLIIDLRENGGGEDTNGLLLYRYLANKPFKYYDSLKTTRHIITDHPNLGLQQPEENNFNGKVEFLISGKSFSGAAEFSAIAKSNARGIFVGEETAGGYYGNTSGSKIVLELPNTKIRVNIPVTKYVMAVTKAKHKDRGIIPDYKVVPTINDYLQHKDPQMDLAIKLIDKIE